MGIDKNNIAVREIGNYLDYVEFDVHCYTVAPLWMIELSLYCFADG